MRVHELAKELGLNAKDLVQQLIKDGISVSSHMSKVDDNVAEAIMKKSKPQEIKKTASVKKTPVVRVDEREETVSPVKTTVKSDVALDEPKKEEKKIRDDKDDKLKAFVPKNKVKKHPFEPKIRSGRIDIIDEEDDIEEPIILDNDADDFPKREFGAKKKKKFKKKPEAEKVETIPVDPEKKSMKLYIGAEIQVKLLAEMVDMPVATLIGALMEMGMMVNQNQNIDHDTAAIVAHEYGYEVFAEEQREEEEAKDLLAIEDDPRFLVEKAPVVTFMGHVDHGKTSLLDYIRKSRVAAGEAGQITQHIGAYEAFFNDKRIVFLDTPGHKAFTAMRARGANVTDIVVLVVAADDGIMEQTREAINHAKAAKVPIIVAINKIDKPNINLDRLMKQLTEVKLMPEDWGGDTICVKVSALTGEGVDHLLEMILIQAEMMELKGNPHAAPKATVVESKMTRGRGPTVTVLVQRGTLRIGDPIVCANFSGKIKNIVNDKGINIKEAGPATPVEVLGLDGVPEAGALLEVVSSEKEAKRIAEERDTQMRKTALELVEKPTTLEELYKKIESDEVKELKLIIKGDVQGSLEALSHSLEDLSTEKVAVKVIHKAVGDVSESDVMLASASSAIILGFCIKIDKRARELAKKDGVQIKTYNIIYNSIDDIRLAMTGMLGTKNVEHLIGMAEVRDTFKISKVGVIAGCMVLEGKVQKTAKARVLRDDEVLCEGSIGTLKRFKDDVKEVKYGLECGIRIENFNDIQAGDKIEFYTIEKVAETL